MKVANALVEGIIISTVTLHTRFTRRQNIEAVSQSTLWETAVVQAITCNNEVCLIDALEY